MTDVKVLDDRTCDLGEGPIWHPERQEFFWFDINNFRLMAEGGRDWSFDSYVSAAGWVDRGRMMIAGDSALMLFDIDTGTHEDICPLDADNPGTRSNDGRADPYGGFWIGTMPTGERAPIGAIYRYYRGEVRPLVTGLTIPNSICFSPDGLWAYWTDTGRSPIWKQRLDDKDGWPVGEPEVFTNPLADGFKPDGSVVDAAGNLWNAQYGAGRVAVYRPDGSYRDAVAVPGISTTCPAFGGAGLTRLYVTTASQNLDAAAMAARPLNGQTFFVDGMGPGQAEHRVLL